MTRNGQDSDRPAAWVVAGVEELADGLRAWVDLSLADGLPLPAVAECVLRLWGDLRERVAAEAAAGGADVD